MFTLLNDVSQAPKWRLNDSYFIKEFYGHFLLFSSLMTKVLVVYTDWIGED